MNSKRAKYTKLIHLLYVPTMFCNLGCQYCYLGDQTDSSLHKDEDKAVATLTFALKKFIDNGILPFNVSLHGGEVTSLSQTTLDSLFKIIYRYYLDHMDELQANNFRKITPHIKTNLYNFDTLYELMCSNKVSISASIDLPLSMHKKYRTTRNGQSTLEKTLKNLALLGKYPHNAKISATLFDEHLKDPETIIRDIWFIHRDIGFDMNNFNFMFGFNAALNREKLISKGSTTMIPADEEKQVMFYRRLREAFTGTELEYGLRRNWFDEFTPGYCTCAQNCGERFLLLQGDGSIYSCVRGQGVNSFHYGNIFSDDMDSILSRAKNKILEMHQKAGFHDDCKECIYLGICQSGCPFVKNEIGRGKSYTCSLQKEIYKDNPVNYAPAKNKEQQRLISSNYQFNVHPILVKGNAPKKDIHFKLPNDLFDSKNQLIAMIEEDSTLKTLYSSDSLILEFNDNFYFLAPQILKIERTILNIISGDTVKLHVKKTFLNVNTKEPLTNTLYLQMLRDTPVVYGDEKRTKQEHIFTYQIYRNQLEESIAKGSDYFEFDITGLISMHSTYFKEDVLNNLFVTTESLRNYHYQKQKNNAFYHIQAINLPFQNVEFYWEQL